MSDEKDIRFTQKKVDESWKDQIVRERDKAAVSAQPAGSKPAPKTSKVFLNLISSLGMQAMMHLGEIPMPGGQAEVNLEAAREMIEVLAAIQAKTTGNLSAEEKEVLEQLVPELQMKFTRLAS